MIRIFAIVVALLVAIIVWQRGSVSIAHRAADNAAAAQAQAEGERDAVRADLTQANAVITAERANVKAANAVAAQYELEKADAQAASDRLVADLHAGNQRLHVRWQAALATGELSAAAAAASQSDGGAADRYQSAGRIIGAADQCDAQVNGLQAFARLCSGVAQP
ncbi:MAG: lysis system i-spanin subunit Rz [Stenotrophomonas sp.]